MKSGNMTSFSANQNVQLLYSPLEIILKSDIDNNKFVFLIKEHSSSVGSKETFMISNKTV